MFGMRAYLSAHPLLMLIFCVLMLCIFRILVCGNQLFINLYFLDHDAPTEMYVL